jgi:hypothetical protein
VKRTLATGEVLRIRHLLLLVIIDVPFWFLLFPSAVTTGLSWTQVTTWTFLSCRRRFLDVDVEAADRDVSVVEVGVVIVVCVVAVFVEGAKKCA